MRLWCVEQNDGFIVKERPRPSLVRVRRERGSGRVCLAHTIENIQLTYDPSARPFTRLARIVEACFGYVFISSNVVGIDARIDHEFQRVL